MIVPVTLAGMVAATRIDATRQAIVASLTGLLKGVAVVGHPGKLDINDVVAKAVVAAPGIAVGYSRVRELGDAGGTFALAVDWVAYLVVEDRVDAGQAPPRVVPREIVGHAIGQQILRILRDPNGGTWGLPAIDVPAMDPAPELKPVFTLKTDQNMTAIYAVTWTQSLVQEGQPFFGFGPTPPASPSDGFPDGDIFGVAGLDFELADGEQPPEITAHTARDTGEGEE